MGQFDDRHSPEHGTRAALGRDRVRAWGIEAGFQEAGVVALPHAHEERDARRFGEWIRAGRAGTMEYLKRTNERNEPVRARAGIPFPWARSAVVCLASYHCAQPRSTDAAPGNAGWIARYAWSSREDERGGRVPSDYHKILLKRMKKLDAAMRAELGDFESRAFVDTGPVVERALASAAGLGWTAKNTCLIHPRIGSYTFLAVLLTSLEIAKEQGYQEWKFPRPRDPDPEQPAIAGSIPEEQPSGAEAHSPFAASSARLKSCPDMDGRLTAALEGQPLAVPDRCGSCTRCIEACPTGALFTPYQMDAAKCISYLTIEHRGAIAAELMPGMGRQVFGCDICQDVCPWNSPRRIGAAGDDELTPRQELVNPDLYWLGSLDEQAWEQLFNGSPVRRAGFAGFRRNVAIAMGNALDARFADRLRGWADAADEGLRAAATWAGKRLEALGSTAENR